MGYDVHITRAEYWSQSEESPIPLDEWLEYVASDPEMRLDGCAEAQVDEDIFRIERDGLSVWTAYSGHEVGGNMAWFDYRSGRVVVKSPDREIVAKMRKIAGSLKANVIGDEGEHY